MLLKFALEDWCDLGRFKDRRLDDVLFHEYDPARDGDFSGFLMDAMYADWQPGGPLDGQPFPPHRSIQWPLLVIQAAINTRDPELVATILAEEARYEVEDDTGLGRRGRQRGRARPRVRGGGAGVAERVATGVRGCVGGVNGRPEVAAPPSVTSTPASSPS